MGRLVLYMSMSPDAFIADTAMETLKEEF